MKINMEKIITFFGIIFLILIIIINLFFSAYLDVSEHVTINKNNIIFIFGIILIGILIYKITNLINNYIEKKISSKKIKNILFAFSLIIYIVANIINIIIFNPPIVGDQIHAYNLAQTFYNGNLEEFLPNLTYAGIPLSSYMQKYHQQISLAFVFSIFFRIIHFDGIGILRVLNIIGNIFTFIALYKIMNQLSKDYKVNKILGIILILTFIPLILLNTFIYGDLLSLGLSLFSVYFMMKYTETKKLVYPISASIFMMIAYMMRMNCLIYIIATVIYLILDIIKNYKINTKKEKIIQCLIIILYIILSMIPTTLVQKYYLNKYNLKQEEAYPNISYFLMAMEESWRENGWYNEDIGEYALKNTENAKIEYPEKIKERLKYFINNPGYTIDFYFKKVASMWAENTYSSVRSNIGDEDEAKKIYEPLACYEKAMLMLSSVCCLITIIKNKNNLSLDLIFLITIFIGGFAFHILWEAKSRYIIPYIVVLIPIASIIIDRKEIMKKDKIKLLDEK